MRTLLLTDLRIYANSLSVGKVILLSVLFSFFLNNAFTQTQSYTTNGTFVVPAGVTSVKVEAWGGGGAGGGVVGVSSPNRAGGGGAGGSYTNVVGVSVTPGATISVSVGVGGMGVSQIDGTAGGSSVFNSATPVVAIGGAGGKAGDATNQFGAGGAVTIGTTFNGGAGATGSSANSGGGGGGAGVLGAGGNATGSTGGVGGVGGGGTGATGVSTANGVSAITLSGGGSGAHSANSTDRIGGNGFRGQVIVSFTCIPYSLSSVTGSTICIGDNPTITLNSTPLNLPVGIYTVIYNLSTPNTATGITTTMTVTTAGNGTFTTGPLNNSGATTITITNLNSSGCTSGTLLINNTAVVTVTPNAAITSVTGTSPVCIGATATYTANGVVLGGGTGAWSSSNTAIATVNSSTGVVTAVAAGTANIIYTITGGCSGTKSAQQAITVTPNAAITSVAGTSSLCIGATATYTATGVVLGGGAGAWSSDNLGIATVNSSTGVVTPVGAGTANIIYTITGGCNGTKSAQQSITVTPNAAITSVTGTSPLCIGATATYTANGVVLGGGTGTWISSNSIVASVDPSTGVVTAVAAGTANIIYTITGGCSGTKSAQQSLTVTPNAAITSVTGTSPLCIGATATYTANGVVLGGGTGAWSSSNTAIATVNSSTGVVTAVGAGTANIVYTVSGGCNGAPSSQQSIVITGNSTITLSSGSGSNIQTVCNVTPITTITYSIGGTGTGAIFTGSLPAGVTGSFSSGVFTISGTPTASGTFNYTVTTTGPCANPSLSGTITVAAAATITLTSGAGSNNQTKCINVAITNITFAVTSPGTNATLTGTLPPGVMGSYATGSDVYTISGTPTASGTFNYTITTTGGTCNVSTSGTITVTANGTITLTSLPATTTQTVCINNAITDITYSFGGTSTGTTLAAGSVLPNGVTGSFAGGVFTISGTPTQSGIFSYTVNATGSSCVNASLNGTITVNARPVGSATAQTICTGTTTNVVFTSNLANTNYTWTAALLSGSVTGFSDASGSTISQVLTNSTSLNGVVRYTVTPTTLSCAGPAFTVDVTVSPRPTIAATPATQTICSGSTISQIDISNPNNVSGTLYNWTRTVVGLTGTIGTSGSGGTISGIFTNTSTGSLTTVFTLTATAATCSASTTVSVTVNPIPTVSVNLATQTICSNSPISNLIFSNPNGLNVTPTYTWTRTNTGIVTGISATGTGAVISGTFVNNSTTQQSTVFTVTATSASCSTATTTTVIVDPPTIGGSVSASQTLCADNIPANLSLSGQTGDVVKWQRSTDIGFPNGSSTSDINITSTTLTDVNIGPLTTTTYFRAIVKSGVCPDEIASSVATITVNPLPAIYSITGTNTCQGLSTGMIQLSGSQTNFTYQLLDASGNVIQVAKTGTGAALSWTGIAANTYKIRATINATSCFSFTTNYIVASNSAPASPTVTPSSVTICQGTPGTLLTASGFYPNVLILETFADAGGGQGGAGWLTTLSPSTTLQPISTSNSAGNKVEFAILNTSIYVEGATSYPFQSPGNSKFVLTNHRVQTPGLYTTSTLVSPGFSTQGMASATISYNHTLKLNVKGSDPLLPDEAFVQFSTNSVNGPWTTVSNYNNTLTGLEYGSTNNFVSESIPLPAGALNQSNVYVRFVYRSKYQGWWWAIDDIGITVSPQVNFTWSPTAGLFTNAACTIPYTGGTMPSVYTMPSASTTYIVTTDILSANGCPANTSVVVTVNTPPLITSQPSASTICLGSNYVISAGSSGVGSSLQWEFSTNGAAPWNAATGAGYQNANTSTLTVVNPSIGMIDYQYRLVANPGATCPSSAVSNPYSLKIRNVWIGPTSQDWQTGSNWSDGNVASLLCDTVHILNRTFKPVLSSGTSSIKNLLIYSGANVTLLNQPSTWLAVSASIVNQNLTPAINALNGRLVLNGTTQPQQIWGNLFTQRTLNYLTVSNSTPGGASLMGAPDSDTLYISHRLNFGNVNGKTFTTNDNLTLMSRGISATASVGDLTNNGANTLNIINGKVTVERWFNARKAWRFLSIPTVSTQTLRTSWQENNVANSNAINPGFGTTITNLTISDFAAAGFDTYSTQGPSVKYYNPDFATFTGIPNTLTAPISTSRGYMTFVRGNRSATTFNDPPSSTILRTSGLLKQGNMTPIVVPAATFADVGNPYAAAIDMRKITMPGVQAFYYLWNPNMGGGYGLGAFQTYSLTGGNFIPTPDDGTGQLNFIQSGQAFLVRGGTGGGSVNLEESDKDSINSMIFRINGEPEFVRANLSIIANNVPTLVDGAMVEYGNNWSNAVDDNDAIKLVNLNENVASYRENKFLSIERRQTVAETDTIFVRMSGMRIQNYQWSISLTNMDSAGRSAFLIDAYLNTRTPLALDDTTYYNFSVQNIAGSYAPGRFIIVFKQLPPPMPVKIISISASRNYDNSIAIDWRVEHETNVQGYTIERSEDGVAFTGILTKSVSLNNGSTVNYDANDISPLAEDNFYRIRASLNNGTVAYSDVAKVPALAYVTGITVFPNPVRHRTMYVKFAGVVKGTYSISLDNKLGQRMHQSRVEVNNNITLLDIRLNTYITPGTYQLVVTSPSGGTTIQSVIID